VDNAGPVALNRDGASRQDLDVVAAGIEAWNDTSPQFLRPACHEDATHA
jgi:hypothetical protein